MKFTRMFLLKSLISRVKPNQTDINNQNPIVVIKEIIVSHPHIDLVITLILSLLLLFTKYNDDINFIYTNSLNFYFITIVLTILLLQYFFLDYLDELKYIQNGKMIHRNSNRHSLNNINQEMNENFSNNNLNENRENNNDSNNNNSFFRFIYFQKIHSIFYNNLGAGTIKLPYIFFNNWHTFKSLLQVFKIFITLSTFSLSLIFCLLFADQKNKMYREQYYYIHLVILDFYEFYSGFRICYFFIKIIINLMLLPVYLSCIILGIIEDKFNERLNKLINTKIYSGRSSLKTPPNGRISELEQTCSICLNNFEMEELISTLPCSRRHTFHTACLQEWFINSVKCPLCRSDFNNSIELFVNGRESIEMRQLDMNERLLG